VARPDSHAIDMADKKVASTVKQIHREKIRSARHLGAAVTGHGGSSLSLVLVVNSSWISKALSSLHHRTQLICRRIAYKLLSRLRGYR